MFPSRNYRWLFVCGLTLTGAIQAAFGNTLCVNKLGSNGCFSTIQAAVNAASSGDVINVAPGKYQETVTVTKAVSLSGANPFEVIIDATNKANGVFLDGRGSSLNGATLQGFTIQNAQFEGVLVVSASYVVIRNNNVLNNDRFGGSFNPNVPNCSGQQDFETDESGDCGGAIHLIGTKDVIVSNNVITGNADGVLISDETGESSNNIVSANEITDNPLECGIVLASHPPAGELSSPYTAHNGVTNNLIADNISERNGVNVGGAGAGLFSDGNGPGRVSGNLITGNTLIGNGIPGVALHTHVGPAFGAPADDMSNNRIIGNYIAGNGADIDDTATPGTTGIIISSGGGGTPVNGTVIAFNTIQNEDIAVAINTPAQVQVHDNNLVNWAGSGQIGVANVCSYEHGFMCSASNIDARQDYWGCPQGPGGHGCSTVSGSNIVFAPWLSQRVGSLTQSGGNDQGNQQ